MVRDHNHRAACRDSRLICGAHAQFDPHLGQQILKPKTFTWSMRAMVEIPYFPDRGKLSSEAGKIGHA